MSKIKLQPKISKQIKNFLTREEVCKNIVKKYGSPVNVIFPKAVKQNIDNFKRMYEKYNISGDIFYAHKANRSKSIVSTVSKKEIGLDIASISELKNANEEGFNKDKIEATGPKKREFLDKLINKNITINVDNLEELNYIGKTKKDVEILIRISGFKPKNRKVTKNESRFGINIKRKKEILETIQNYNNLSLKGFSFHLSTSNIRKKRIAISNILDLHQFFSKNGIITDTINIGGGFSVNYLKNRKDWDKYLNLLKQNVKEDNNLTWKNENYGFYLDKDTVKGSAQFYDYYNSTCKGAQFEKLLNSKIPNYDRKFYELLNDFMLDLYIEPGRALLDQAGVTLTKVIFTKKSIQGEDLIAIDANKFSLYSTEQEMMIDPVLLSNQNINKQGSGFIVGNLCLESDLIYKHKTFFEQMPETDDILAFINTAAYNMDFAENKAIHHETAKKIVVRKDDNKFKIKKDK